MFAVLTLVTTLLVHRRANLAGEAMANSTELVMPLQTKVVLKEPGNYEVVWLAHVAVEDDGNKPSVDDVRGITAELASPAAQKSGWRAGPKLASLEDKGKPMLVTLGTFDVASPGPRLLSLRYAAPGVPRAKVLFGKDVRSRADAAARWAFAVLLSVFLGGCLTVGSLLMGVVFGTDIEKNSGPLR